MFNFWWFMNTDTHGWHNSHSGITVVNYRELNKYTVDLAINSVGPIFGGKNEKRARWM